MEELEVGIKEVVTMLEVVADHLHLVFKVVQELFQLFQLLHLQVEVEVVNMLVILQVKLLHKDLLVDLEEEICSQVLLQEV